MLVVGWSNWTYPIWQKHLESFSSNILGRLFFYFLVIIYFLGSFMIFDGNSRVEIWWWMLVSIMFPLTHGSYGLIGWPWCYDFSRNQTPFWRWDSLNIPQTSPAQKPPKKHKKTPRRPCDPAPGWYLCFGCGPFSATWTSVELEKVNRSLVRYLLAGTYYKTEKHIYIYTQKNVYNTKVYT